MTWRSFPLRPGREQCWQELILYAAAADGSTRGIWNDAACKQAPRTCAALQHPGLIGEPKQAGYGNLDIILNHFEPGVNPLCPFLTCFGPHANPHAPCGVLYAT